MITNFNQKNRTNDIKLLCLLIVTLLIVVWFCTTPGSKFAHLCFYGNNTQFFIAKLTKPAEELDEWIFHRNNAIYLTQMERKKMALKEIDLAMKTLPSYVADSEVSKLHSERAQIRMFWGDYKGALNDMMKVKDPTIPERFRLALLYKKQGNNKYALSYCNSIMNTDPEAYAGYACLADVYAGAGRYGTSVKVYNMLFDRTEPRGRYYADRAFYKKKAGDITGYYDDMKKAKELTPNIENEASIVEETMNPKRLTLSIM